ncbi:MAG: response regulator [Roseinatronobacter sp.]|jgi:DNA-binding NarL/FixJ family response regulator|nr:response regulator [Roseinatronobacter sp.]
MPTDTALASHMPRMTAPADVTSSALQRGRTLLLVEDSRLSSDAFRMMFNGAGGRMRRADSLLAARRHLALYTPDAVLIDLGLPDGSGLDLIRELADQSPRVPRIIATSGQHDLEAAAYAAGADAFLPKPIDSIAHFRAILAPTFFALRVACDASTQAAYSSTALRDDLYLALDLLQLGEQGMRRGYALQFIEGIARSVGDDDLLTEVTRARHLERFTELALMLRERLRAQPPI